MSAFELVLYTWLPVAAVVYMIRRYFSDGETEKLFASIEEDTDEFMSVLLTKLMLSPSPAVLITGFILLLIPVIQWIAAIAFVVVAIFTTVLLVAFFIFELADSHSQKIKEIWVGIVGALSDKVGPGWFEPIHKKKEKED